MLHDIPEYRGVRPGDPTEDHLENCDAQLGWQTLFFSRKRTQRHSPLRISVCCASLARSISSFMEQNVGWDCSYRKMSQSRQCVVTLPLTFLSEVSNSSSMTTSA